MIPCCHRHMTSACTRIPASHFTHQTCSTERMTKQNSAKGSTEGQARQIQMDQDQHGTEDKSLQMAESSPFAEAAVTGRATVEHIHG